MYCIYDERRYTQWNATGSHIRQFREDKDGERYPVLNDNKAIIYVVSDSYFVAKTIDSEILAISDTFATVLQRIRKAQPSAEVTVHYGKETIALEQYYELVAPRVYRVIFSQSETYGELVAMDIFENGEASNPVVFDNLYDAIDFITEQQRDDDYYYVAYNRRIDHSALDTQLGIEEYEMTDKERDYPHLRTIISRTRQKQRNQAGDVTENVD